MPIGVNRTWVKYIEEGTFPLSTRSFSVMRCNHCSSAPCVTMCPVTALYKRDDGIVDFDNDRCIGCKACTQACPYDALYIDPVENTAAKCNYCSHRVDIGLQPACVVVCPEQAIIAGDMSDPLSEISKLLAEQETSVRKPEKETGPNVFYIDAKAASLEPTLTDKQDYLWSSQDSGVGYNKHKSVEHAETTTGKAKRTYDAPDKGIMWGWEVVGYLITKGIGAGAILVISVLSMCGMDFSIQDKLSAAILGLTFIALTGALLVKDLGRPERFIYIIFRPQFKSWLARGTYIILGFSALMVFLIAACLWGNETVVNTILYISAPAAVLTAIYTAFLFAQAKGRAFWDNKMSIFMMLFHAIILGLIALSLVLSRNIQSEVNMVELIHVCNIAITLWLFKGSKVLESKIVSDSILKGSYKLHFWLLAILIGNVLPLALFFTDASYSIATFYITSAMILVGVVITNYLFVKVPQQIALS